MTQLLFWIANLLTWAAAVRAEIILTPPKVYSGAVYTGKGNTEVILPSNARPSKPPSEKGHAEKAPPIKTQRSKSPSNQAYAKKGYTDVIDAAIAMHRGDFKSCFEKQAKLNPDLQGLVVVQFSISEHGKVVESTIKSTTLKHPKVERCVLNSITAIGEFPKPGNGITLQATYPFNFVVRPIK